MEALALVLGKLFQLAYSISFSNYLMAIFVFTLMTKIILLPISIWTQYNGIKLVKMRPELNEIKVKYYGDKDAISDETLALYKREKYNAFVGIIPLFIQIIILVGIIGVVRTPAAAGLSKEAMVLGNIRFYDTPLILGGLYWLMPILAGASALVLSLSQNKMNPLQAEQSKAEKFGTMGFSIGISLFLGAFVPLAVGTYWIASNLLTIVQQFILNIILNPKKYIDYERLEASRKKLAELEQIGVVKDKAKRREYSKREKEDYKRFFKVVNKKLVFYSERNGFFKYFEAIFEYILENSNVIIHYITSDPDDDIFEKAKHNPRIKPYFIQEKKLITLFMKMDADIVVMTMTDLDNYHYKRSYVRKDIEYVYVFHAINSTHMVLHHGAFDHYDTLLCVGEFVFPEVRKQEELYHLPAKKLIACGYGLMEKLKQDYDKMEIKENEKKTILIAPSWQEDNILDLCLDELLHELLGKGWDITVRPHPEYVKRYCSRMDAIVQRYAKYTGDDLHFELDFSMNFSSFLSDIVITDWSAIAFEFSFVTGKPTVFIDTPVKILNSEYERIGITPTEVVLRDQIGIRLSPDSLEGTNEKLIELLEHVDEYKERNYYLRDKYIANFGHSGEVGGQYIIDSLREKIAKRKELGK